MTEISLAPVHADDFDEPALVRLAAAASSIFVRARRVQKRLAYSARARGLMIPQVIGAASASTNGVSLPRDLALPLPELRDLLAKWLVEA